MSHKITQLASLDISLNNHNTVVILESRSDKGAVSIEAETTRVQATGGSGLDVSELTALADLVGDKRVGGDCAGAVEGGDCEGGFVAGRGDDEFSVGLSVCQSSCS
jgi:hypothetical protein